MRCGIYSLVGRTQNGLHLNLNPVSGDVFVFIGKRCNQIRLLYGPTLGGPKMGSPSI
ncbi:IS66 family insertion sequence element accessory protein TnpB [Dyadobacter jejuensis]|uniref:IS66 family insertion sequence element accessory protein TnpB n=1 Tax=Dyadobacter jejuensis TaxID=1082580 RepID=UPI000D6CC633